MIKVINLGWIILMMALEKLLYYFDTAWQVISTYQ